MELVIDGSPTLHTEGTVTVELPSYMRLLPADELTQARTAGQRAQMALAAGRHPRTGDLVFITGIGEIVEVHLDQLRVPETTEMYPIDCGHTIRVVLKDTDAFDPIEVATDWAIHVGHTLFNVGTLADERGARVSYLDHDVETDAGTTAEADPGSGTRQ